MAKDRNGTTQHKNDDVEAAEDDTEKANKKSRSKSPQNSDSESEDREELKRRRSRRERSKSRKRRHRSRHETDSESESGSGSGSESESESESEYSDSEESEYSESGSEKEEERRRRRRKEKRRRRKEEEKEEERERKRRKREKRRRREREERERERRKRRKEKEKKKKVKKERGKKGAVTDSWGKYGVIRETDMWNKRPEFTAWLAEVKQVNLESLANWEEKQMFKVFMEDHNTATFPSKKYYNLDAYHKCQMEKVMKKGFKKLKETERTVFNDEEQRRQELLKEREKQKEEEVESLKYAMQSGMAQAMKEQARLREEMAYQYKLGNFEAAAAIQRRLDPDVAM